MRRLTKHVLGIALLGSGVVACQDLDVINENLPDTERALREPAEVEQVIRSAFPIWVGRFNNGDTYPYFSVVSSEMAWTGILRQIQPSFEPRQGLKNDPVADEVWIPRSSWDGYNSALANSTDGLQRIIRDGLRIMTLDVGGTVVTDNTDRARIFGKVMEGLSLGYLGLVFDRNAPRTHHDTLPGGYDELIAWERDNLTPYSEVIPLAVGILEDAIADMDRSTDFTLPLDWINQQTVTKAKLREIANSFIARLLVYSARTPAERAAVDWQKVLAVTGQGLTSDFVVTMQTGTSITQSQHLGRLQNTNSGSRAHYSVIGPADVSGKYQAWVNAPLESRDRFDIVTPDRRITGPTPTSNGAYFRYRTDNTGFDATRGTYNFSAYQWYRKGGVSNSGPWVLMSVDENRLLRAEAYLRTNNLQEAVNLINVSRTREVRIGSTPYQGLPAVTPQGVAESATCVPRNARTGACGSLMEALIYEREIEAGGWDPFRTWMDRRGLGTLVKGTILHLPIPARYLVSLGVELYSFGGVGGPGAAQ